MIRACPVGICEYVTLHVPETRVHVVELKVPVAFDENVTVPVGVMAPAPDESATVAAHVVFTPELTEPGVQVTVVVVARRVEASVNVPLLPV